MGGLGVLMHAAAWPSARAEPIVLTASADNTLYETTDGSTSNGAGTAMFAGRNSQSTNSIRRGLVRFDVAGNVPAGSTILSVQLTMFNDANNTQDDVVSLHRVTSDWGEGASGATGAQGSGAAAQAGDATWLHSFFNTQLWSQAGGDFAMDVSASATIGATGSYTWGSTPGMAADVQAWLDNAEVNFGWCVVGNETSPSTAKRFGTHEEPDDARRPKLIIEYGPAVIPAISEWGAAVLFLAIVVVGSLRIRGMRQPSDGHGLRRACE